MAGVLPFQVVQPVLGRGVVLTQSLYPRGQLPVFLLQFFPAPCSTELFRQYGHVAGLGNKPLKRGGVRLLLSPRLFDLLRMGCDLLYQGVNFSLDSGPFGLFPLGFRLSGRPGREMLGGLFDDLMPCCVIA